MWVWVCVGVFVDRAELSTPTRCRLHARIVPELGEHAAKKILTGVNRLRKVGPLLLPQDIRAVCASHHTTTPLLR